MQPDPARVAETREWFAKAALDLRAAEFEFTAVPPLTADIAFYAQQLAEKALKGFLTWHDQPFRKTHNLVEIGQQCVAIDATLLQAEIQEILRRSPTKTLLWLDPQHGWERLLDQFATEIELVMYDGSQLELRVKIEVEPVQTSRIVYLPLARQGLSALKEYEFTLPLWDEGLLHALHRWGVGIDRDEEKALLPLLPSLATR
jgi:uncharacterized protein YdhG (YjbR/CyaY superfamily)